MGLSRMAGRFLLFRHVWHPALFVFAVYLVVLSSMTLVGALKILGFVQTMHRTDKKRRKRFVDWHLQHRR
jgi:hypothetical protein